MNAHNPASGNDTGLPLNKHLSKVQDEACALGALLEGVEILLDDSRGGNAVVALISIALQKANKIHNALDITNLPSGHIGAVGGAV